MFTLPVSPGTIVLLLVVFLVYRNPWILEAMHAMGNEYNSQYIDEEVEEDGKKK